MCSVLVAAIAVVVHVTAAIVVVFAGNLGWLLLCPGWFSRAEDSTNTTGDVSVTLQNKAIFKGVVHFISRSCMQKKMTVRTFFLRRVPRRVSEEATVVVDEPAQCCSIGHVWTLGSFKN